MKKESVVVVGEAANGSINNITPSGKPLAKTTLRLKIQSLDQKHWTRPNH